MGVLARFTNAGEGWRRNIWRKGWDSNPRGAYTPGGFQDRCLKPLGHPSPVTTSNTYALALVEQTSHRRQLATARARPRSRARVIWARLILNERRAPPESASHWRRID